jgi:hypothetical protein
MSVTAICSRCVDELGAALKPAAIFRIFDRDRTLEVACSCVHKRISLREEMADVVQRVRDTLIVHAGVLIGLVRARLA